MFFQELRKSTAVKQQLEMYKRQVHELQSKMSDETKRADKADFECKRAQEKLVAVQREKEVRKRHPCFIIYSVRASCNLLENFVYFE